jgi:tRNA C32,U32 (ribose-2'-O)-methylase TrmJ
VPVAVELRRGAELLPAFEHPERALYVFGPEDGNLTSAVLARCHRVVAIPTRHCVNLAAAVYLVLYDRMVKRQAGGLEPAVPLASALADDRGWLEPDSMAPDVGVEPGR